MNKQFATKKDLEDLRETMLVISDLRETQYKAKFLYIMLNAKEVLFGDDGEDKSLLENESYFKFMDIFLFALESMDLGLKEEEPDVNTVYSLKEASKLLNMDKKIIKKLFKNSTLSKKVSGKRVIPRQIEENNLA